MCVCVWGGGGGGYCIELARKDVDVNEHVRLSNFTPRHKLK